MNRIALLAAGAAFTAVLVVTVSPLQFRPRLAPPQVERFAAWALVGALGAVASPRRTGWIALAAAVLATGSEALQLLVPERHAHLSDALAKAVGAVVGALTAGLLHRTVVSRRSAGPRRAG